MTRKTSQVRSGILLTLILITLAVIIAAGFCFAGAGSVYADEAPSTGAASAGEEDYRENKWETKPAITGWDYFKYSDNLTLGEPTYGVATYSVFNKDGQMSSVNKDLDSFAPDKDGKLSEEVIKALNELEVTSAGYVLHIDVPAGTGTEKKTDNSGSQPTETEVAFGYAELTADIDFKVSRATNAWKKDIGLSLSSWQYGSYNNATHKITPAVAEYGTAAYTVLYTETGATVGGVDLREFYLEDGALPQSAVKAMNALSVGTYSLVATVSGTDNYTAITTTNLQAASVQSVNFEITKATDNHWLVSSVSGWSYGAFNANFIQMKPACGEDRMRISIYRIEGSGNAETATAVLLNNLQYFQLVNGEIPRAVAVDLNSLGRGNYSLVATVAGNNDYPGLNEELAPLKGIRFEITGTTNTWLSTPNIVQWTWGSFSKTVNVLTAVPNYPALQGDKKVSFGIYRDSGLDDPVTGLTDFTTVTGTAYGEQVSDDTARLLAALPAGTYYLNARSAQSEDYNGLSSVIQFTVAQARNYWTATPQIVQWAWNGYNPEVNAISATPAIGEIQDVVYGVYTDRNCNEPSADLVNFSFERVVGDTVTYVLPEAVATALAKLDAGTYYLKAEVAGTENYSLLTSVTSFSVQKVNNYWLTTPSAVSWTYGSYNADFNTVNALPAFGDYATFAIYHENGGQVLFSEGDSVAHSFTLLDGAVPEHVSDILATLGTGKYYVLASVAGTANYTGLNEYSETEDIIEHGIELDVTANPNGWVIIPRVLGWAEGRFDAESNRIIAEAVSGNDNMRVTVLDARGAVVFTGSYTGIDYDKLAGLDVGSYTVKISIDGNGNYAALSGETTFAVTEDAVGLTGIIAAVVVFGVFDIAAAAFCIYLVVSRRRKIEESFRNMIRKELHRR